MFEGSSSVDYPVMGKVGVQYLQRITLKYKDEVHMLGNLDTGSTVLDIMKKGQEVFGFFPSKIEIEGVPDYFLDADNFSLVNNLADDDVIIFQADIKHLLQKLEMQESDIPSHLTTDSDINMYLHSLSEQLSELNLQMRYIPNSAKPNLKQYLQSISELILKLQNPFNSIPSSAKENQQVLEFLQVQDVMRDLEITPQQIPNIFANSFKDMLNYLHELKRGKQSTKKLTLMVVGEEGVGKTSLIQHILSGKWIGDTFSGYDFQQHQRIPRTGITDGIDIHLYQPEGKDFIMNIYDFAGQEIYYSTHQFVLSSQAIYFLLFDASKSINANRIAHWVHTLTSVAPGATVFIVGTHFDHPSAIHNFASNLSQLRSILDNIQFLSRDGEALQFITPSQNQIPPLILSSTTSHSKSQLNNSGFPIWPIALTNSNNDSSSFLSSSSSSSSESYLHLNEFLLSVLSLAEKKLENMIVPASWLSFRSYLFPQLIDPNSLDDHEINKEGSGDDDDKNNKEANEEEKLRISKVANELYSELSYKVGIMTMKEFEKYGKLLKNIENISSFVVLMEYWGEVVYIRNYRNRDSSLLVIKPSFLISLFKQFITAKKLLGNLNTTTTTTTTVNTTITNVNTPKKNTPSSTPHLLRQAQLETKLMILLDKYKLSQSDISHILKNLIIPVFINLRLMYPISSDSETYFIPAMVQKAPSLPDIITFKNHSLLSYSSLKIVKHLRMKNIVIVRRIYEFIYLPSGLFHGLMMEVWKHFSILPNFSRNLFNDATFWENGGG